MIPRINTKNISLSIVLLFILCYIVGDIIIPKIAINHQIGTQLYFIFCILMSVVYVLWFFNKFGKEK